MPWRKAGLNLPSAGERLALQTADPEARGPVSQSISEKTRQWQSTVLAGDGAPQPPPLIAWRQLRGRESAAAGHLPSGLTRVN